MFEASKIEENTFDLLCLTFMLLSANGVVGLLSNVVA
jgi:hypothetical protein